MLGLYVSQENAARSGRESAEGGAEGDRSSASRVVKRRVESSSSSAGVVEKEKEKRERSLSDMDMGSDDEGAEGGRKKDLRQSPRGAANDDGSEDDSGDEEGGPGKSRKRNRQRMEAEGARGRGAAQSAGESEDMSLVSLLDMARSMVPSSQSLPFW